MLVEDRLERDQPTVTWRRPAHIGGRPGLGCCRYCMAMSDRYGPEQGMASLEDFYDHMTGVHGRSPER